MQTILEMLLANAVLAAMLAGVVYGMTRVVRKPAVAHALWMLVLLKLVTPPIVSIPIPIASNVPVVSVEASEHEDMRTDTAADRLEESVAASLEVYPSHEPAADAGFVSESESAPVYEPTVASAPIEPSADRPVEPSATKRSPVAWIIPVLLWAWAIGSILWAATTYLRIRRFRRCLLDADLASPSILDETQRLAAKIGLRRCPEVRMIAGRVPPMALAMGGRTAILLPPRLIADMTGGQLSTLLAHELSHLRRLDPWVRRLEMAAMLVYWWHPVLWLARRELQRAEESCCDAWVAWMFRDKARDYGEALLATLDYLGASASPSFCRASTRCGSAQSRRILAS